MSSATGFHEGPSWANPCRAQIRPTWGLLGLPTRTPRGLPIRAHRFPRCLVGLPTYPRRAQRGSTSGPLEGPTRAPLGLPMRAQRVKCNMFPQWGHLGLTDVGPGWVPRGAYLSSATCFHEGPSRANTRRAQIGSTLGPLGLPTMAPRAAHEDPTCQVQQVSTRGSRGLTHIVG